MKSWRVRIVVALSVSLLPIVLAAPSSDAAVSPPRVHQYQFGINTYFTYGCQTPAQINQWATTTVAQYKALGANSIAIAIPLYTDSITSNSVYAKDDCTTFAYQSPPPSVVAQVVDVAHAAGLQVLFRPLIDQKNLFTEGPNDWRGVIAPTDLSAWFASYLTTLRPYLIMAQAHNVEHFVLETELNSIASASYWSTAIALSRRLYHGDLVWNYSWDTPVTKITRPQTSLGIDAYPKVMNLPDTATVPQLVYGWNHLLRSRSYYVVPKISATTIDEIGIPAQRGAFPQPYMGSLPPATNPFDQTIQARWFTAACDFMKQHQMRGIYYWGPWLGFNSGSMLTQPTPSEPTNIQPLAQAAIKKCFTTH